MKDLNIITTGDLELTNGDLVFVDGLDQVRQRVLVRLRTQRGEWAFDETLGLDYLGEVFRKDADTGLIRSRVLAIVATTPGVSQVRFVDVATNNRERTLSITYAFLVDPEYLSDSERAALGLEPTGPVVEDTAVLDVSTSERVLAELTRAIHASQDLSKLRDEQRLVLAKQFSRFIAGYGSKWSRQRLLSLSLFIYDVYLAAHTHAASRPRRNWNQIEQWRRLVMFSLLEEALDERRRGGRC